MGDRKTIGDDLDRPTHQGSRDLQRGGPTVKQYRLSILYEFGRGSADGLFLDSSRSDPVFESRHRPNFSRIDRPAVSSLDRTGKVERFKVAPHRALGDSQRLCQFVKRCEALTSDQIQQKLSSGFRKHFNRSPLKKAQPGTSLQ